MTAAAARPRVVVTGLGAVTAWGWGIGPLRQALFEGRTAIGPFSRFDSAAFATQVAAQVPPAPEEMSRRPQWRRLSWADRFALAAAREAVSAAGLAPDLSGLGAGLFFGGSTGGLYEAENLYEARRRGGLARAARGPIHRMPAGRPGEAVARALRIGGPVETVCSACASGSLAIAAALDAVRSGEVRLAIAGGADSLCRVTYGGFNALRAVDRSPCRPFRDDRAGMSLGEGGAVLVLERLEAAQARRAPVLAEIRGGGASADAHHMTAPEPSGRGAALAMRRALDDAACDPEAMNLLNAHGTGTPLNDRGEFAALERLFGERARSLPVAVTKASVGHLLGGAGAVEAVATVLALVEQRLQPAPGGGGLDPQAPAHLAAAATPCAIGSALSLNLGFGGVNAALVFGRAPL